MVATAARDSLSANKKKLKWAFTNSAQVTAKDIAVRV
jgi:hypothetical protein